MRRGWMGLLRANPDAEDNEEWITPLSREAVRRVDRSGGTFLHTSRTNPGKVKPSEIPDFLREPGKTYEGLQDLTPHILNVIDKFGIDCLIPIGGDDTLSYASRLHH
ncbi:MAG TPA: 6-phosphofructokinase, partial [Anaerolineales bacterium]|nr:6-phosphofructokinase [Anaerolineales bacterium]